MKSSLSLGLRSGEKIYINGAVVRVDRKVRLELLNDATFFLESHIMKSDQATTSLRKMYFLVQGVLMDPSMQDVLRPAIVASIELIVREGLDEEGTDVMRSITLLMDEKRYFGALKLIRGLIRRCEPELGRTGAEEIEPASHEEVR